MLAVLSLALQLQRMAAPATPAAASSAADSARDVERAHDAQAGFERGRRYVIPWGYGSNGRCDVRVGRFCWWYEGGDESLPPEPAEIGRRRAELLAELDALGERRPSDPWIAGMRIYYRVDDRRPASADSAARTCRAAAWWCTALRAFAAHAANDVTAADSGFAAALAAMPDTTRCAWRDISTLLPGDARGRYEHMSCAERQPVEARYWLLATPRLSAVANDWRTEFYARRVAATLLASAVTPHRIGWGRDTEELLLRYGWPVAWSRIAVTSITAPEPEILGHDRSPSFHFGPGEALLDSTSSSTGDGWDLRDVHAASRYAPPGLRRVASVDAQLARFRRGDSTLLVAAWTSEDDSLSSARAALGALAPDGRATASDPIPGRAGRTRVLMPGSPRLAGVELLDSASGSFARSRMLYSPTHDSTTVTVSDLLLFRPAGEATPSLDEALEAAIPGDAVSVAQPLGLYWESYAADSAGPAMETAILVERTDHGFFRSMRQRVGLTDPDSPLQVRWSEPAPASGGRSARSLSLDLATLPPGRYRLTLAITPATGPGVVTVREVRLMP